MSQLSYNISMNERAWQTVPLDFEIWYFPINRKMFVC